MYRESENLELKSSLSEWKDIIITLGAFANKNSGKVIVGLNDNGEPLGMNIGKGAIEDLVNKIKHHTDPILYPLPALREAIINAIVHRDYTDAGNIQVRIFDDRLEIWSPGLLPKEIDIKNLLNEYFL